MLTRLDRGGSWFFLFSAQVISSPSGNLPLSRAVPCSNGGAPRPPAPQACKEGKERGRRNSKECSVSGVGASSPSACAGSPTTFPPSKADCVTKWPTLVSLKKTSTPSPVFYSLNSVLAVWAREYFYPLIFPTDSQPDKDMARLFLLVPTLLMPVRRNHSYSSLLKRKMPVAAWADSDW